MADLSIHTQALVWAGEHWLAYLRRPEQVSDIGRVSLYHTRYSPAGEGNVALVDIPGEEGLAAVCTDNRELAEFILETMIRGREGNPFQGELPIIDARITRGGDVRHSPSWTIDMQAGQVVATWSSVLPPLVLIGPGLAHKGIAVTFSLLFFTEGGAITLNGRTVGGEPYVRESWQRAIGRVGSSCCFALAETMTTATQEGVRSAEGASNKD